MPSASENSVLDQKFMKKIDQYPNGHCGWFGPVYRIGTARQADGLSPHAAVPKIGTARLLR